MRVVPFDLDVYGARVHFKRHSLALLSYQTSPDAKMAVETHRSRRNGAFSSPYFENATECKYTMKI